MSDFSLRKRFRQFLASVCGQNSVALIFILFFLIISVVSILGKSRTYDEAYHLRYGMNILDGDSTRFNDSEMPFSAWNALPAKIATYLPAWGLKVNMEKLIVARLMTTLFSMVVAFMVFQWSRKLYGFAAALVSLGLYVFDPNIIAHSQLVTTDIYGMGMTLLSCYWLWRFADKRDWRDGLTFSVVLGLAQLAKYTAVSLYPVLAIAYIISDKMKLGESLRNIGWLGIVKEVGKYIKYSIIVAIMSLAIINVGFLFNHSFIPFQEYQFRSSTLQSMQGKVNFLVPTPHPFLEGLDWIHFRERTNLGFVYIYLLGRTRLGEGFPGYYAVVSLLKVPIASQIIIWIALCTYFLDAGRRQRFMRNELFLLWPVLFYSLYFNFLYKAQIGLRHYLVVFPLLYVFAGGLFKDWMNFTSTQKRLTFASILCLVISLFSYYPNYLGYVNEFIWDRKMAYKYFADSNLDWGQDYNALTDFRNHHPDVKKAPEIPIRLRRTATYFVSVNELVGALYGPHHYAWLRENFEPVGMIAPSYLLFEIAPDKMDHLCVTTNYCK